MQSEKLFSGLGIRRREPAAKQDDDIELEGRTPSSQASLTATGGGGGGGGGGGKLKGTQQGNGDAEKQQEKHKREVPKSLQWVPENYTYVKMKPVIRCAVAAWIALILFLIPPVQRFFGQASFLILIGAMLEANSRQVGSFFFTASVLSPPNDPFVSVLEREVLILLFATTSWA
ncbi:hypothetical protein DXG03_008355 [Asterophora parasitica]|uniref:Putative ER transporter 6TM N-terminal domain-containing protein n=1 Tax=Asterophora parasitica TaxID=117018 RepID=A0A9P7KAC2_9AGAR|nr:hypothetical protein DXG03_008355 [Asterophora parasitica]